MKTRHQRQELQMQRNELDRKIKELQTIENMEGCQKISFKVLKSSGAWSDELETICSSEVKKLKAAILKMLEARK